ncbi:hypothetical protein NDU88_004306 [Pleurodeles waltl]|uniref:Uncharacterized protein n=1 Tax=Pleurodeles waltl TaxID=8319 RepID=A0AAV7PES6_PLEWA|nr:hypothetical protein NDU88_004306 [Pleurodeles waltl]
MEDAKEGLRKEGEAADRMTLGGTKVEIRPAQRAAARPVLDEQRSLRGDNICGIPAKHGGEGVEDPARGANIEGEEEDWSEDCGCRQQSRSSLPQLSKVVADQVSVG